MPVRITNSNDVVSNSVSLINEKTVSNIWDLFLKKDEAVDGSVVIPSDTLYSSGITQLSNIANLAFSSKLQTYTQCKFITNFN